MNTILLLLTTTMLFLSVPTLAMPCSPETQTMVITAQPESVHDSVLFDCELNGEPALSITGELTSTLVRARSYIEAVFTDANGKTLSRLRRGEWLGRFYGLNMNESLPVPTEAKRIQIITSVESSRPDASGELRVSNASLKPSISATLVASDSSILEMGTNGRWVVQTDTGSPSASAHIELLSLEGVTIQQKTLALPSGGGQAELSWLNLPVGYYDIRVVVHANGLRDSTLQSSLAVVPKGEAPHELRFGIDAALSWYGGSQEQIARSVHMMRQAGIGTVRDRLSWAQVQPLADKTQWGRFAEVAAAETGAGLDVVQVFHNSPSWARNGSKGPADRQPPTDDNAAYEFGKAYAQGLGKTVRNIEYWNEPNMSFFNGYPYQYASGLKAFSSGVKSIDPAIHILIASAADKPGQFFEEIYRNNVANFFDIRNQHYYGKDADIVDFVNTEVADRERRTGINKKSGWLTEMGYSLKRDGHGDWRNAERTQAEYLVKTYIGGFASGYDRVFFFFWRELVAQELNTWGIIRDNFSPRPAYVALAVLTRHLANSPLVATEVQKNGMTVYFHQPAGTYSAVTWGGGDVARFGTSPQAKDIYGRAFDLHKGLPTNGEPILLSGIEKLPSTAKLTSIHSTESLPEAPLRISVKLLVAGQPIAPATKSSVTVGIADNKIVTLSGRVFSPKALIDGEQVHVQCSAGKGIIPLTPAISTLPISAAGTPFECSFRTSLSTVGESFIAVTAEHSGAKDSASIALSPDTGQIASSKIQSIQYLNSWPRYVQKVTDNIKVTLVSLKHQMQIAWWATMMANDDH